MLWAWYSSLVKVARDMMLGIWHTSFDDLKIELSLEMLSQFPYFMRSLHIVWKFREENLSDKEISINLLWESQGKAFIEMKTFISIFRTFITNSSLSA